DDSDMLTNILNISKDKSINAIKLTPSHLAIFNTLDLDEMCNLKLAILGGEALHCKIANKFIERCNNHVRLINEYGPTEATIGCMVYEHKKNNGTGTELIGTPIDNMNAYIIKNGSIAKVGEVGELYLSGASLANGYINNEKQTAKSFIKKAFNISTRLYKTGDLVKKVDRTNFAYIGRIDNQVKINGYRIELDEIKKVVLNIKGINNAEVFIINNSISKTICLCYESISKKNIVKELSNRLPDYMIPQKILWVRDMPLTINGKVDKQYLYNLVDSSKEYIKSEKNYGKDVTVINIFKEILKLDNINKDDNLFELGGRSIEAMQILNLARSKFNKNVSMAKFIQNPTPRYLEQLLDYSRLTSNNEKRLTNIQLNTASVYEMSETQKGVFYEEKISSNPIKYNIPAVWKLSKPLKFSKLKLAVQQIIDENEIFRTIFYIDTSNFLLVQQILDIGLSDVELIDARDSSKNISEIVKSLIKPFDITTLPLFRVRYIRCSDKNDYLFFDIHHLISDGRSQVIFMELLKNIYEGRLGPKNKYQYKEYAHWLNTRNWEKERNYWETALKSSVDKIQIPFKDKSNKFDTNQKEGESLFMELPSSIRKRINESALRLETTEYVLLLSAFAQLINNVTGVTRFWILSPFSGRTIQSTENMLGLFTNTTIINIDLVKNSTWDKLVSSIKAQVSGIYDNQDYPYSLLSKDLNALSNTGIDISQLNYKHNISFVLQNNKDISNISIGNSRLTQLNVATNVSKCDLTFLISVVSNKYQVQIEYLKEKFSEREIINIFNQYKNIISKYIK
ncbi:MAG: AMP-binding protein, partial [Lactobacillus sp.]|nr:AMP-binding protein [Lactobacillus sp.]